MRIAALIFLAAVLLSSAAYAQLGGTGSATGNRVGPQFIHRDWGMGISGGVGTTGPGLTPCLAGQFDYSLATGCNAALYFEVQ